MSLKFIVTTSGSNTGYDISDIVNKVTWSGRKNNPARSVQISLLDDPNMGKASRLQLAIEEGNHIVMLEDDTELFRGIIMSQSRTQNRTLAITAYDNGIYLSNNRNSFKYKSKTLSDIFMDVCKRYGITRGETAVTKYKFSIIEENTTIYDVLCQAMSKTYNGTGERYYIISKKGQLHLLRRKEQITKLVLETGTEDGYGNITQYTYQKSIADVRTRLKLISNEGKVVASWSDKTQQAKQL